MIFLPILHIICSLLLLPLFYTFSSTVFTSTEQKLAALLYIGYFLYGFVVNINKALQRIIQYYKKDMS